MSEGLNIQLVVPMAGTGSRFVDAGYAHPKPLLPIHGRPMYQIVLANLVTEDVASVTLVAQRAHLLIDEIANIEIRLQRPINLIEIDHVTQGPADSVRLALEGLNPDWPVVTANSDQYVDFPLDRFYDAICDRSVAGAVLTMEDGDPKWSFVAVDNRGHITVVREKEVISRDATVGIYAFRTARILRDAIESMFAADDRTNGEFYLAPAYNYLIQSGQRIKAVPTGPVSTVMYGLGTPEDYEAFLQHDIAVRASDRAREILAD